MERGLLVTGLPRSGTSWVGKMLEACGSLVYVNEPMNPSHPPGRSPGVLDADVEHYFEYVCTSNERRWVRAFADTLELRYRLGRELRVNRRPYDLAKATRNATAFAHGRMRGRRPLLDDPYAILAAPWLAQRFDLPVLVLVREPVSFVAAWRAHRWVVNTQELLDQPLLMRHHLDDSCHDLESVADSDDWLASTAMLWAAIYRLVLEFMRHDDRLHLVRYEDLVRDPMGEFHLLYERFRLPWTAQARHRITEATVTQSRGNDKRFRWSLSGGVSKTAYRPMNSQDSLHSYRSRLAPSEIARVDELTQTTRDLIYPRVNVSESRTKGVTGVYDR